jgi:hypothetical protein
MQILAEEKAEPVGQCRELSRRVRSNERTDAINEIQDRELPSFAEPTEG